MTNLTDLTDRLYLVALDFLAAGLTRSEVGAILASAGLPFTVAEPHPDVRMIVVFEEG